MARVFEAAFSKLFHYLDQVKKLCLSAHLRAFGRSSSKLHSFLSLALGGAVSGEIHALFDLPCGRSPLYLLNRRLGEPYSLP